ncbi:FAD-dependent oxidoreductase [Ruegeria conchae]|uniref:Glycine/D-amino acid oxidase-like deaminating enzyme n=1 Tax=Ruegeria conchae TaxID=981384 RepID=A0A497ZJB4_9RHOB|nr:FAD-dependent oxidoreductase [Ruegeria conchae]RLK07368.1 glycine/D-amino acid oxidase-like deaminating enzyme [Ruegeria conchae]
MTSPRRVKYLVIGGGFYGCCLALFLRSTTRDVVLVEAGSEIMTRASRVNQARLHSGFHYPRSMLTALKSRKLCHRFANDFPDAIVSDFQMLYAVARQRSKVSANRFRKMFENMKAPIALASRQEAALFDDDRIEAVFRANEFAFDYSVLANQLAARMDALNLDLRLGTEVLSIDDNSDAHAAVVHLSDGSEILADHVFNVTYAQINHVLRQSGLPQARLKHEMTELALVDPPDEMQGYAVTVMDGPFFSLMPYPAAGKYSLTHVRYTPHVSWTDQSRPVSPYDAFARLEPESRLRHMVLDASRYLPCVGGISGGDSIYEVKTVLVKNEVDDGRPILVHEEPRGGRVTSVLGGKIDNIYDLFSHLRTQHVALKRADFRYILADRDGHVTETA